MTIRIAAALLLGLSAVPAAAQTADFTGPRAEVTAGWDQIRFNLEDLGIADSKESDIAWGGAVGYDMALTGNLIAGIEATVSFSDVDAGFSDGTTGYVLHAKRDLSLSARLGTRIGDNALLYGKLGYTNFRVGAETTTGGVTTLASTNLDGVRVGGGLEVALTPRAYLKSEYRYSNYQDDVSRNEVVTGIGFRF